MKSINIYIALFAGVIAAGAVGCSKVLDKKDLAKIPPELVFNDSNVARLNLDNIYEVNLPAWGGATNIGNLSGIHGELSEESFGESKYFQGVITNRDVTDFGTGLSKDNNYGRIRTINMFIEAVRESNFTESTKRSFISQALFFRAWRYFDLVRIYGGVPLVLTPLEGVGEEAKEEALLPRNSTADCIKQIVSDLDSAILYLPGKYADVSVDYGRITSGAAAAFKGRVLLTYASPQFNPNDLVDRWQAAYDANLKAKQILDANGFKLHSSYNNMWFETDLSKQVEGVMITGYNDKTGDQVSKGNGYDNSTRPSYLGTGGGSNQPSWELVKAYPMKDGKKPGESAYDFYDSLFYKNRDPRFNSTIAYNGCTWAINGNANYRLWTYFYKDGSNMKTTEPKASNTGFYCKKAIMPGNPVAGDPRYAGTDWMEIRYAEVLLNLGESAVGISRLAQGDEGYQALIEVRKRAGLEAGGDGLYGLAPGMSRDQLFDAILFERQIEFAFEGKRFWDLRRWKKVESTLNGKRRHKMVIYLRSDAGVPVEKTEFNNPSSPKYRDVTDLDFAYANYFQVFVSTESNPDTRLDTKYAINWQPSYYFFPIPIQAITNNPNIQQNIDWGGTFDPLK